MKKYLKYSLALLLSSILVSSSSYSDQTISGPLTFKDSIIDTDGKIGAMGKDAANAMLPNTLNSLGLGVPLAANVTCTTSNGSAAVIGCNSTEGLAVGMVVYGPGVPLILGAGATKIASSITATGFTMTANAGAGAGTGLVTIRHQPFYSDHDAATPSIITYPGRLMVGGAIGTLHSSGGTQLMICPTSATCANWATRDSQIASISTRGGIAITGMSRASDASDLTRAPIGLAGFLIADLNGRDSWAQYLDVQTEAGVQSVQFGIEIAAKNKAANFTSTPYQSTYGIKGIRIGSSPDISYGGSPANPADTAIEVHGSAGNRTWNRGIVFNKLSLSGTDGVTGTGTAIQLAKGHTINWLNPQGNPGGRIRSDASIDGRDLLMLFSDDNVDWYNTGSTVAFRISHVTGTTATNFHQFYDAATGVAPKWYCNGTNTNIGCDIQTKGSGVTTFKSTAGSTTEGAIGGGMVLGAPTGGAKGVGTLNPAGAIYDNGTAPTGTAGTGYVRATSPTLVTPTLGAASATSITGLNTPSNASDAVNKAYADAIAAGVVTHAAVAAATTANLTATASGTGPGKTLTNSGAQAAFATDGYSVLINERVLVKNQTATADNGIYTLTTVGTGATNWVLTRATDFDAASAAEVSAGASVVVINGQDYPTGNKATQWLETGQGPFTLETTPILFNIIVGGSGNGTVNNGTINQFGIYASAGQTISGQSFTGLMKGNGASAPGVYGGTSCTSQFPRSLDLNGVATCATVGSSDLASSLALTTPAISGGTAAGLTGFALRDTSAAFDVTIAAVSSPILNSGQNLIIDMSNASHTLDFGATSNTITFPNTASYSVVGTGDVGTVTNTMLAGSIATSKLIGTATNDNAAAGVPGEFLSASGAAVSVTSTTQTNITSLTLTAGDWDVSGQIKFNPAATTTSTVRAGGLSLTTAVLPVNLSVSESLARETGAITAGQLGWTSPLGTIKVSTAGTPTIYCVGRFTFATSTATADCVISARRVR